MYYPLFTAGYALAYAEYTQTFVLQYYGEFYTSTGQTCKVDMGSNADVNISACQLTFEETLKSVFPFSEQSRTSKPEQGAATVARSFMFHPTRTGGTQTGSQAPTSEAETLTFKHIFGRGSLLSGAADTTAGNESTSKFHDLTPLTRDTGTTVTNSSAMTSSAYTNGKYTITDTNGLKQKVRKCYKKSTTPCGVGQQPACNECEAEYSSWGVKVVSMEAKITSLKVVWKHVRALPQCAAFLMSAS